MSISQYISVYLSIFWGLSLWRHSHPGTYPGTFTERYNMIYFYIKSIYWDILSSTWYILRCAQAYLHKLYGLVYTKIYFYTKIYLVQPSINWDIPWHTNHRPGYNTKYVQDFVEHIVMQWCRSLPVPLRGWTLRLSLWGALRGALILQVYGGPDSDIVSSVSLWMVWKGMIALALHRFTDSFQALAFLCLCRRKFVSWPINLKVCHSVLCTS